MLLGGGGGRGAHYLKDFGSGNFFFAEWGGGGPLVLVCLCIPSKRAYSVLHGCSNSFIL